MTTSRPKRNLRPQNVGLLSRVVLAMLVVLGFLFLVVYCVSDTLLSERKADMANALADAVSSTISTFGETGDMDGLKLFISRLNSTAEVKDAYSMPRAALLITPVRNRHASKMSLPP